MGSSLCFSLCRFGGEKLILSEALCWDGGSGLAYGQGFSLNWKGLFRGLEFFCPDLDVLHFLFQLR